MIIKIDQTLVASSKSAAIESKLARLREARDIILNRLAGIATAAVIDGDTATMDGYKRARRGLLDITASLPDAPDAVDALIATRYAAILQGLPSKLAKAFAGVAL